MDGFPSPFRTVAHELDRRRTLRSLSRGEVSRAAVCDATREVRSSAEVLGVRVDRPCPVCGADLRETQWIHGAAIGEKSGTARSLAEIRHFLSDLRSGEELTVHTVEVCLRCGWNHLCREDGYRGVAGDVLPESGAAAQGGGPGRRREDQLGE
ncbi:DUF5318 family protein [Corynebacterium terpenotabidum]|uniref:DUF5318 family protein n=1 Tax=Corynebacterium terpenotabidum TaxID=89154 RepID=UPI00041F0D48|nr:DUF5318 family protein [Corynebacterium terpenotabidum]